MKKFLSIILLAAMTLLSGCEKDPVEINDGWKFQYCFNKVNRPLSDVLSEVEEEGYICDTRDSDGMYIEDGTYLQKDFFRYLRGTITEDGHILEYIVIVALDRTVVSFTYASSDEQSIVKPNISAVRDAFVADLRKANKAITPGSEGSFYFVHNYNQLYLHPASAEELAGILERYEYSNNGFYFNGTGDRLEATAIMQGKDYYANIQGNLYCEKYVDSEGTSYDMPEMSITVVSRFADYDCFGEHYIEDLDPHLW